MTKQEKAYREALLNARLALLNGNWSVALGTLENALGIVGTKKAA